MISYAQVKIKDGQVYSLQYDDIYYNTDDGPAESEYVFLKGNDLPAQWQEKPRFAIAETGFGTGLNFLVTLKTWLDDSARCETLDYYAIEAYPLRSTQLAEIHALWPQFKLLSTKLIEQYPSHASGCHSLSFGLGRVQLHLIFEDIKSCLRRYRLDPDCWFLDGFAPARNPSMWTAEVLNSIALQSRHGTTLSTFTAAGEVRRNLISAGFEVHKHTGFGRKREMLRALKPNTRANIESIPDPDRNHGRNHGQNLIQHAPWFAAGKISKLPGKIAVIGAGIAGVQTAWHLAQRGVEVVLIEQRDAIASAASGNRAGVLAPKLIASASAEEAFYLAAFAYQLRQIETLNTQGHSIDFLQNGLLQLACNPQSLQRFERLSRREDLPVGLCKIINANQASKDLGEKVENTCLLIEQAGCLSPASLCHALLKHPKIELRLSTALNEVSYQGGNPQLKLSSGDLLRVDALVLANGYQAAQFSDSTPVIPVRGQTSCALLPTDKSLGHALRHTGYIVSIPGNGQQLIFGASYIRGDTSDELCELETRRDFDILKANLPKLAGQLTGIKPSHAGIRATTSDRWPIVGPLADVDFYQREYEDLHQGKQYKSYPAARYQAGIYMLSGLGSRGLTSAAYCANLLVHSMLGCAPPAPSRVLHALHPARFLIRNLRKGR
jgi:tRNA 5-methylaminomethyl-2-thiouridine biosynthesis bifunctional protein